MLLEFGKDINKCCIIAARQAAEGNMFQRHKIQRYEKHSPSLTAGGSTRSFSGSQRGGSDDVITVRRQPDGSVQRTSFCPNSQLARMRGSPVGYVNDFTGVQTSVCRETTSIQRGDCVSGRGIIGLCPDGRNRNSFKQTGDQSGARGGETSGLLFSIFCNSKERGYNPSSNSGPSCVKQTPDN